MTYSTGTQALATLSGTEKVVVDNGGPQIVTATAAQIAALAARDSSTSVITALNTVGAGTVTAAGIVGGTTSRGGAQSSTAFADTTDTAAHIIAALPTGAAIGVSFIWRYDNNTNAFATIGGGSGVTVSALTVVANNTWAEFLVTYTAANTVTMVGVAAGPLVSAPPSQLFSDTLQAATLQVGGLTGAQICTYINTGTTPGSLNLPTAAQIIAAIPNAQIGYNYLIKIRNASGSANTATITTNVGITLNGTNTIAQNTTRTYNVLITAAATLTMTPIELSAAGA